jgi:16S rRNA (guanine(527)-N(7))-methyltransferase RsmG
VADLGSGAGVPGVPLKIVRPELRVTLIESRERRASFLSAVVRELGLQDCRVVGRRAEDVDLVDRSHDVVVVRCAGDLTGVVPVAAALVRAGGLVIASGPPKRPAIKKGLDLDWVEIEGAQARRLFAVYRKPVPLGSSN